LRKINPYISEEMMRLTPKISALVVEKIRGLSALAGRTLAGSASEISGPEDSMLIIEV